MTYTIGNVTQTKSFERQQFSSPAQICRSGTPTAANTDSCYQILQAGQTRRVRTTSSNSASANYTEKGMGTRTFEGKITQMWQTFDEANRLITRLNYTLTQDNFIPVLSQSIVSYTQTVARAANETVTVPAGTFSGA